MARSHVTDLSLFSDDEAAVNHAVEAIELIRRRQPSMIVTQNPTLYDLQRLHSASTFQKTRMLQGRLPDMSIERMQYYLLVSEKTDPAPWFNCKYKDPHFSDVGVAVYAKALHSMLKKRLPEHRVVSKEP